MLHANIILTESAIRRIRELQQKSGDDAQSLRIYITGGGCSGFQYGFKFDVMGEDDYRIEQHIESDKMTASVIIDALSMQYLDGATVDFIQGLQGTYFSIKNPNAESTCGCGSSFTIKEA